MANVTFTKTKQKLEQAVGAKVYAFLHKLTVDDTSVGLHIEKIHNTADTRVRTGRVDDNYRAVLFLLNGTVGHHYVYAGTWPHDEAIARAQRMTMRLNDVNGVAEFYEAAPEEPVAAPEPPRKTPTPMAPTFQPRYVNSLVDLGYTADYLVSQVGIGRQVAERVLRAEDEAEFHAAVEGAPTWQGVALLDLDAGYSLNEVRRELELVRSGPEEDELDAAPEPAPEEAPAETPALPPVAEAPSGDRAEVAAQDRTDAADATDTGSDDALIEALRHPASRMQFIPLEGVGGVEELRDAIERGSFEDWTVFLHPEQRRFATRRNKNSFRVSGGAGTGKTVVAVHRARNLSRRAPDARVLLTTFTTTLAEALDDQLARLDPSLQRAAGISEAGVIVAGIDALANRIAFRLATGDELQAASRVVVGYASSGRRPDNNGAKTWQDAIAESGVDLPPGIANPTFLEQEYLTVILPNRITEAKDYVRVSRTGRGTALNRARRVAVWKIVETYRQNHRLEQQLSYPEIAALAAQVLEDRAASGKGRIADHVIIDEGQDLHPAHWQMLRAAVAKGPDDLFISEDSHQRIYGQKLRLSHYGIYLRGRARRLTLNYRTTAQNLEYALDILEGTAVVDLEGITENRSAYRSVRSGPAPRVLARSDGAEERAAIADVVAEWIEADTAPQHIGILVRSGRLASGLVSALEGAGIKAFEVKRNAVAPAGSVQVMTMHRAKGMEFQRVVLAGLNTASIPAPYATRQLEEAEREDKLQQERSLLYVASTRARDELVVTYSGDVSEFLP